MIKLVIFKFGDGDFEQGFPVTLQIREDGQPSSRDIPGRLPSALDLLQHYSCWQYVYRRLGGRAPRIEVPAAQETNISSRRDCHRAAQNLLGSLDDWLCHKLFLKLRDRLLEEVKRDHPVRIILQTHDLHLCKLPWHQCDLFRRYSKTVNWFLECCCTAISVMEDKWVS